jgi:trafficking protein particle complex subunit 12
VQGPNVSSPALQSAIARIYLQGGHIGKASKHFAAVAKDPNAEQSTKDMNAALLASAEGEWAYASELLTNLVAQDSENYVVRIIPPPA